MSGNGRGFFKSYASSLSMPNFFFGHPLYCRGTIFSHPDSPTYKEIPCQNINSSGAALGLVLELRSGVRLVLWRFYEAIMTPSEEVDPFYFSASGMIW